MKKVKGDSPACEHYERAAEGVIKGRQRWAKASMEIVNIVSEIPNNEELRKAIDEYANAKKNLTFESMKAYGTSGFYDDNK